MGLVLVKIPVHLGINIRLWLDQWIGLSERMALFPLTSELFLSAMKILRCFFELEGRKELFLMDLLISLGCRINIDVTTNKVDLYVHYPVQVFILGER